MSHLTIQSRALVLALALAAAAGALFIVAQSAYAGVGLGVAPTYPSEMTIGSTDVAVSITFTNQSTADEATDDLRIDSIRQNPGCGDFGTVCASHDPGVFSLSTSGSGRAGTACEGIAFAIAGPDAGGFYTMTPDSTLLLAAPSGADDSDSCTIDFTVDVLAAPEVDIAPDTDGNQVGQYVEVAATAISNQNIGLAAGTDVTTIVAATPTPTAAISSQTPTAAAASATPAVLPQAGGSTGSSSGGGTGILVALVGLAVVLGGAGFTFARSRVTR